MSSEIENPLAGIEQILVNIPLCSTPAGRAFVFGAAGGSVAYFVRPAFSFNADGTPRPWILTNSGDANATLFPYWAWVVLPGVLFSVFV